MTRKSNILCLQAVRCAIQEIISSGQRYGGVFGQVKQVHEFVTEHTNFSKKQIRSALKSEYMSTYNCFILHCTAL